MCGCWVLDAGCVVVGCGLRVTGCGCGRGNIAGELTLADFVENNSETRYTALHASHVPLHASLVTLHVTRYTPKYVVINLATGRGECYCRLRLFTLTLGPTPSSPFFLSFFLYFFLSFFSCFSSFSFQFFSFLFFRSFVRSFIRSVCLYFFVSSQDDACCRQEEALG